MTYQHFSSFSQISMMAKIYNEHNQIKHESTGK